MQVSNAPILNIVPFYPTGLCAARMHLKSSASSSDAAVKDMRPLLQSILLRKGDAEDWSIDQEEENHLKLERL